MRYKSPDHPILNILVIVTAFPPDHSVGARRWGLLARELAERHNVVVVKSSGVFLEDSKATQSSNVQVIEVPYRRPLWQRRLFNTLNGKKWFGAVEAKPEGVSRDSGVISEQRNPTRSWLIKVRFYLAFPCTFWSWARDVEKVILARQRSQSFDIIIGSSPSISCVRAASRLGKQLGIPWIADFRDPFAWYGMNPFPEMGFTHRCMVRLENRLLKDAAAITAVNKELLGFISYSGPQGVVLNPADPPTRVPRPDHSNQKRASGKFRICYAGSVNERNRHFGEKLFQFIAESSKRDLESHLRFVYCGWSSSFVNSLAQAAGVAHLLDDRGLLPARDVELLLSEADVLVLLSVNARAVEFMETAKMVEYLFSGTPIIAIGNSDSHALRRVIEETGVGWFVTNHTEFQSAMDCCHNGRLPVRNEERIRAYYPDNAVRPLEDLISDLVKGKPAHPVKSHRRQLDS